MIQNSNSLNEKDIKVKQKKQLRENNKDAPNRCDWALRYAAQGNYVFPVHSPIFEEDGSVKCSCGDAECNDIGKHPRVKWSKEATIDPNIIRYWWQKWPNANIGISTGPSHLVVIDLDGLEGIENFKALVGENEIPATAMISMSGREEGGVHFWFRASKNIEINKSISVIGDKIDIIAKGGYIVAPPSLHATGNRYQLLSNEPVEPSELPEWLIELLIRAQNGQVSRDSKWEEKAESILNQALKKIPKAKKGNRRTILNKQAYRVGRIIHLLNADKTRTALRDAAMIMEEPLSPEEIEKTIDDALRDGATKPLFSTAGWRSGLVFTENGGAMKCPGNVVAAFRHPDLEGLLAFDTRFCHIDLMNATPWDRTELDYPREWDEADNIRALEWLTKLDPTIIGQKNWVSDAAVAIARENVFEPFRDYLDSLSWDSVSRLETALIDICGAEDNILNRVFFKRWLISAVARTYRPGCKADYMLVLVSEQGLKKSTFFAELLPDSKYFREGLPKGKDKDTQIAMQGPVIIEDPELSFHGQKEVATVKAFISIRNDKYRAPYERTEENHPRRVVLAGTGNEQDFLYDATGGRRFWPVTVRKVSDIDTLRQNRDQLWAEAVHRYRVGEQWWLTDDEEAIAKILQEDHREISPIEERLQQKLRELIHETKMETFGLTSEQIEDDKIKWITVTQGINLLGYNIGDKSMQYSIGKALRGIRWEFDGRHRVGKLGQVRIYRAPTDWQYEDTY